MTDSSAKPAAVAQPVPPPDKGRYKAVVTLWGQYVASRFDQTSEAFIATVDDGEVVKSCTVVLATPSADELCRLILSERADVVICGGIQRRYHEYLTWKKVCVLDSVMGPWEKALDLLRRGELASGAVLYDGEES